jgi:uncharacterized OB-fold protein
MDTDQANYRPLLIDGAVIGARCERCGYAVSPPTARCPSCGGPMIQGVRHASTGRVWSSTVIRIPVGQRVPPIGYAYIDLDDGPRVLSLFRGAAPLAVGSAVELSHDGKDLVANPIEEQP